MEMVVRGGSYKRNRLRRTLTKFRRLPSAPTKKGLHRRRRLPPRPRMPAGTRPGAAKPRGLDERRQVVDAFREIAHASPRRRPAGRVLARRPPARSAAPARRRSGRSSWGSAITTIPRSPDCPGAIRDARSLAAWFAEGAGWGSSNVLVLRDGGNPTHGRAVDRSADLAPSRINLNWAVKEWVPQRVKPGDLVVLYFAGQAASTPARDVFLPPEADARARGTDRLVARGGDRRAGPATGCAVACLLDTSLLGRGTDGPRVGDLPGAGGAGSSTAWPAGRASRPGSPPRADPPGSTPAAAAHSRRRCWHRGNGLRRRCRPGSSALERPGPRRSGIPDARRGRPGLAFWPQSLLPADLGKPELVLQRGHADRVTSVRLSADGERMVTASMDSTVRIWRVIDGERVLLRVLADHRVGVTALGLDPGGRLLASGDGNGRVRVWDLVENRPRLSNGRSPHSGRVEAIAFFAEGQRFAALDQSGRCVLWDGRGPLLSSSILMETGVQLLSGDASGGAIGLAIASDDGTVTLLDGEARPVGVLGVPSSRPTALDLAESGGLVAVGNHGGRVEVWDPTSRKSLRRLELGRPVTTLRLGPDGLLAIGDGNGLTLISVRSTTRRGGRSSGLGRGRLGLFLGRRPLALRVDKGRGFRALGPLGPRKPPARPPGQRGGADGTSPASRSRPTADGWRRGRARAASSAGTSPTPANARGSPSDGPTSRPSTSLPTADACSRLAATGSPRSGTWKTAEDREPSTAITSPAPSSPAPIGSSWPETATTAAVSSWSIARERRSPTSSSCRRPPPAATGLPAADFARVAASPDGRRVAASTARGREEIVCVWDASGGSPMVLKGHDRVITDLGFSRDGQSLLTAGEDGSILLWDLITARPVALPERRCGHRHRRQARPERGACAVSAHWSPDGPSRVVLWEWDRAAGPKAARRRPLGEPDGRVLAVVFSADGRFVAAAGDDRRVRVWEIAPGKAPKPVELDGDHPENQHAERVNALVAWPDRPQFASGGNDTAVKLWGIDAGRPGKPPLGTLLGTLSAAPAVVGEPGDVDWVAYTPMGVFDASNAGDRAVAFAVDREVRPLDQFAERFHRFRLTNDLRGGHSPEPAAHSPPPPLAIDPPAEPETEKTTARLRISVPDPALKVSELRLYHNGVPARVGEEDFQADGPGSYLVEVAPPIGFESVLRDGRPARRRRRQDAGRRGEMHGA